ncbi:UDP-N-acetylglucosamine 2-epimerase [Cohaesibacter gelatinilyticus]|uniref:GDP/UDP-N,N'-diacetylbacillosamine 2-epimerase (Hydrolysing) n=1 Tax=Cohaesibacter gelatinilyticus TaxID=372072 RepID=A0A285PEI4_9HYPH|nr:UDP-N-acetylglucosamine 2-epimerase [Cohaesibacter gelatinilyticus]SNZ20125.1 GDP/UDP-N,N'-diacetylbacillosamine 2-epimerase (hydrolysing) [Cohaesibacter gelatinilyticus]
MSRKICVITGTRAEYGLLRWVMDGIHQDPDLTLQIIATGMHLSPEFGLSYQEIEQDGYTIDRKVEMLVSSDTSVGIAKAMGLGMIGMADALNDLQPDIIVVLGDRFEIFSAISAAMVARIPVAHLHGGEATEGLIDEAIRHSITKMSHLHFVAAEEYKNRVIQLGEQPNRVHLVGGMGIDGIKRLALMDRAALEESMDFRFGPKNLIVTFHPVTLETATAAEQMQAMFDALDTLEDIHVIFTMPNADTDGRIVMQMVDDYVSCRPHTKSFTSLGQLRYLSCLAQVDGMVGNSSSGLIEMPSFCKGTVNIGDRQKGRIMADSVIGCMPESKSIQSALQRLYSTDFQNMLNDVQNPYGDGGASERVVAVLKSANLDGLLKKQFFDVPTSILPSGDSSCA